MSAAPADSHGQPAHARGLGIPRAASGAAIAIGVAALVGWWQDIAWLTSPVPGPATMNPTTALALVLLGAAVWLNAARPAFLGGRVPQVCGAFAALIGLARLAGYAFGFDPGVDHLLFAEHVAAAGRAGRLAPHTALNLLLVGAALLLERRVTRRAQLAVQVLTLVASVAALVSVTGHAYGTAMLSGAMALNTALAFLFLAVGVLWSHPEHGVAAQFASPTAGGTLVRRLVPAIILIPLLLGWLRLAGQRAGLYDTAGGTALFVVCIIVVLAAVAASGVRAMDHADARRRAAERTLGLIQARLQQVLASSTAVIYTMAVTPTGFTPTWVSENITRIMGYDLAESLEPTWWIDHVHPEDRARVLAQLPGLSATGGLVAEYRFASKDGTYHWVRDEARLIPGAQASESEVVGVWVDITERRRAEHALRLGEERFRLLVGSVRDYAIYMLDPTGHVASWNRGAQQIKGYAPEEIVGQHFSRFYPPEAVAAGAPATALRTAVETGRFEEENWRVRKDGSRFWADVVITPIRDEPGTLLGFAKVTRDLTERKAAEETLRRYAAQLESANAELDAFAYSVSHDLRAPLRSLDGFSQALLEDHADRLDAEGTDYLQRVRSASQRMAQLIDDLLDLSRVTRSQMRVGPVDLSAVADGIATELRKRDPSREVEFAIAPALVVQADPGLMGVVLENLLGNAWKFTGKRPRGHIEVGVTRHNGHTAYFVRDDGAGFDMTYADKLFGAFQRLHASRDFEGTGIGLATVQRIIHRHGGRVWAEAVPDRGATFYFTLS